ncbi:MAG: DUF2961 domain-containing protein, partial [Armatimonadetes bacterium]|nr:DUF2961 domain-containing protein [Armatimonadota bacterium]
TGIAVAVQNDALDAAKVEVVAVEQSRDRLPPELGRFHAWWHRENPIQRGKPFTILEATGRGHWCGVSHAMRGIGGLGFLEGDEQISADGRAIQTYHGTGTEDYFNGGWYFGGPGRQPLWGVTVHDDGGSRCHAFRLHVTDCVPFQRQASLHIEHGAVNDYPSSDYAGVTYWYAEPGSTHTFEPVPVAERLGTSPRRAGVIEAENNLAGGGTVIEAPVWRFDTGGHGMVEVSPAAPVTLTIPAGRDGLGTLQACAAQPGAAALSAELDGKPIGRAELAAGSPATQEVAVGAARWSRGEHRLTLTATGGPVWIDWLRVVPAPRAQVKGAVVSEAEELPVVAVSDGAKAEPEDLRLPWSALAQLAFRPTADGQEVTVELTVPSPRPYELLGALTRGPEQGIVQAWLGGRALGEPVDAYAEAAGLPGEPVKLGLVPAGQAGKQRLTLRVVGKSGKSGGRALGVDYLALRPTSSAGWFEAEKLPIVRKSPETAEIGPQDLRGFGPIWSEGAHLWFRPGDHADASFTLRLTVAAAGRYSLGAYFTKAIDYGKVAVELDGKRLGEVFDGFNDGVVRSDFVTLGAAELTAGEHELTFRATGKHERSVGYMVGVDAVYLW